MADLTRSNCVPPRRGPAFPTSMDTRVVIFEEDSSVDLMVRRVGYGEFIRQPSGDILCMDRPWTLQERFQSREVNLPQRNAYVRLMGRFSEGKVTLLLWQLICLNKTVARDSFSVPSYFSHRIASYCIVMLI